MPVRRRPRSEPRPGRRRTAARRASRTGRRARAARRCLPCSTTRPAVEHEDDVGGEDRRQPVGDRDRRPARHQRRERGLHEPLAGGVERAGRLVEDEHPRVLEDHARDREPLLLPAGQPVAALADDRVVASREAEDALVDLRGARRRLDLGLGRVGLRVGEVLADGRVEQVGLLGDHPDRIGEGAERDVAHVLPVEPHRAPRRVVQPRDQVRDRRLAGAARARPAPPAAPARR